MGWPNFSQQPGPTPLSSYPLAVSSTSVVLVVLLLPNSIRLFITEVLKHIDVHGLKVGPNNRKSNPYGYRILMTTKAYCRKL